MKSITVESCAQLIYFFTISYVKVEAQSVGDWAEKRRVLGSSPGCQQKLEGALMAQEVPGLLQSIAEVLLSKVLNP